MDTFNHPAHREEELQYLHELPYLPLPFTAQVVFINETAVHDDEPQCVDMNRLLWLLRDDPTSRAYVAILFALLYGLIIVIGICGNVCVITAIFRTKTLQTVSNLFILTLSCSDIIVCCVSATFTPFTAFSKVWLFGPKLCSLVPFIAGTSLCFSTFTLAAISVDRFLLIRFPLNNQLRHRHAFCIISLIIMASIALSVPMLYTQKLRKLEGYCGEFCFEDWGPNEFHREVYGTLLLIIQFFVPLTIITLCYTGIAVRLNKNLLLRRRKMGNSWQIHHQRMANRRRQRTNRMFVLMVFAFILSWISSVLFNILRDFRLLPAFIAEQEFLFGVLTHSVAMTSTIGIKIWNPILYALLNLQFRVAFLQLMPQRVLEMLQQHGKFGGLIHLTAGGRAPRNIRLMTTAVREYPPMLRGSVLVVRIAQRRETSIYMLHTNLESPSLGTRVRLG